MASLVRHRQRVVSPIDATNPRLVTSCLKSGMLQRENGKPYWRGSSQARALMATITLGGKAGWTPAPWLLLEAGQTPSSKNRLRHLLTICRGMSRRAATGAIE